jgi:hypothetical protein
VRPCPRGRPRSLILTTAMPFVTCSGAASIFSEFSQYVSDPSSIFCCPDDGLEVFRRDHRCELTPYSLPIRLFDGLIERRGRRRRRGRIGELGEGRFDSFWVHCAPILYASDLKSTDNSSLGGERGPSLSLSALIGTSLPARQACGILPGYRQAVRVIHCLPGAAGADQRFYPVPLHPLGSPLFPWPIPSTGANVHDSREKSTNLWRKCASCE